MAEKDLQQQVNDLKEMNVKLEQQCQQYAQLLQQKQTQLDKCVKLLNTVQNLYLQDV